MALASFTAWRALVEKTLGADSINALTSRTSDDIPVAPLYPASDAVPLVLPETGGWRIGARIDHPDPVAARDLAALDIAGGAELLTLVCDGAPAAHGFGVKSGNARDFHSILTLAAETRTTVRIEPGPHAASILEGLAAFTRTGIAVSIELGLDPVGTAVAADATTLDETAIAEACGSAYTMLRDQGFVGPVFAADGRIVHAAGGSEAQELAFVLAAGVGLMRILEQRGVVLDEARHAIGFTLAADVDLFLTIAKFRTLRRLWARVELDCGLEPAPIVLGAETAWRMLTRLDPATNMLRNTIAAAGAALGGADAITVLPHTAAWGLPDTAARRMARNIGLVLREEAHLGRVADPLAGSGAVEAWTEALARKAWALFGTIEGEGGLVASLASGAFQARVAATRAVAAANPRPIVGTSLYAEPASDAVSMLMSAPPADSGDTLRPWRVAEPFEQATEAA